MALQELTGAFIKRLRLSERPIGAACRRQCIQRRCFADAASTPETLSESSQPEIKDLEHLSFAKPSRVDKATIENFDPVANAKKRGTQLPPSRYSYRPPRYYRGPLHPHQPPPVTDPASRVFVPGPFSSPRLEQTYESTLAPDYMTLAYAHYPPGTEPHKKGARLRSWEGDSPYFKNRPLRGPRGGDALRLLRKRVTFRTIPRLSRVTVHTYLKDATDNSSHLHAAGMVLQSITNIRATPHRTTKANNMFGIKAGKNMSVTCELRGEDMYHFLSKLVDVVLPKIKDWKGVAGTTGDGSGNLAFGLTADEVALFPEIEINYDMYPTKHIPGLHIIIHTTATQDRDARLLLMGIGIPFHGKLIN